MVRGLVSCWRHRCECTKRAFPVEGTPFLCRLNRGLGFDAREDEDCIVAHAGAAGFAAYAAVVIHIDVVVDGLNGEFGVFPEAKANLRFKPSAAHASAINCRAVLGFRVHFRQEIGDYDGGVQAFVKGWDTVYQRGEAVIAFVQHNLQGVQLLLDCGGDGNAKVAGGLTVEGFIFFQTSQGVAKAVEECALEVGGNSRAVNAVVYRNQRALAFFEASVGVV